MTIYHPTTVNIGTNDSEPVEVMLEVREGWDRQVVIEVMGVAPRKDPIAGWVWEPFLLTSMQAQIQELVNKDQDIRAECEMALGDAERMSA